MGRPKKLSLEEEVKLLKEQNKYLVKEIKKIPKTPAHRPYIFNDADFEKIEGLCALPHIKEAEVADIMGVSIETLCKALRRKYGMGYKEFRSKKLAGFLAEIATVQRNILRKHSTTMAIYLGKVHLGQVEDKKPQEPPGLPPRLIIEFPKADNE